MEARNEKALWVFGYGSLCWNPGFSYIKSVAGHVKGFTRKFWQGNTTHRGTTEKPGRVATVIEDKEGVVYGRAFLIEDSTALPYLQSRECTLGGYITATTIFYSRKYNRSFPVILYIATNKNKHWLGEASLHSIARQISESSGPSGHNVEYLLRLANFMRDHLPEAEDEHLFTLEQMVRSRIRERNMCLDLLMGNRDFVIDLEEEEALEENSNPPKNNIPDDNVKENSFLYVLQVTNKKMRCLKM